jgi:hypothetical protein
VTVYIDSQDNSGIAADVTDPDSGREYTGRVWFHLIADTQEELHAFAARIGMQRRWFQDPTRKRKGISAKPGSRGAENWHYDLTGGKRWQAVRAGAVEVTPERMNEIINDRYARNPASCTCTNECSEEPEYTDCLYCKRSDIYDPCPAIGFGCGMGAGPEDKQNCECCTPQQWAAAAGRTKQPAGQVVELHPSQ